MSLNFVQVLFGGFLVLRLFQDFLPNSGPLFSYLQDDN